MVAPIVWIGSVACGDIASEAWDIDDVGLIGAFTQHECAAAVLGGFAYIEHLRALFAIEQFDLVEQVDGRDGLVDLHLGAAAGHLCDDVIMAGA